jgi:hypothetical protein
VFGIIGHVSGVGSCSTRASAHLATNLSQTPSTRRNSSFESAEEEVELKASVPLSSCQPRGTQLAVIGKAYCPDVQQQPRVCLHTRIHSKSDTSQTIVVPLRSKSGDSPRCPFGGVHVLSLHDLRRTRNCTLTTKDREVGNWGNGLLARLVALLLFPHIPIAHLSARQACSSAISTSLGTGS